MLILNEKVDIKNPQTIDDWDRLIADVYYKGKNIADYFPLAILVLISLKTEVKYFVQALMKSLK